MKNKAKVIISVLLITGVGFAAWLFLRGFNIAVLNPKGSIAAEQVNLMIIALVLMLLVVIPVFVLTFFIVWKYRASNKQATYSPNWDRNRTLEALWWGLPLAIIAILSVIIWRSSHALDPYKPLDSSTKPVTIQVVALDWKWLFLYPDQGIATVNTIHIPQNTPINFKITADAPMNSFWIPNLGGQVYAMAGMETKLHLDATQRGTYEGSSANISGEGFAGMRFGVTVDSREEFASWVTSTKKVGRGLSQTTYDELRKPSSYVTPALYSTYDRELYDRIIMKYMKPGDHNQRREDTSEHAH